MWCLATCGESDWLRRKWGCLYEGYFTSHRHGCTRLCWLCTADDIVKGRHLQCPSSNIDHARHTFARWCVGGCQQFDDYLCHERTILGSVRWYSQMGWRIRFAEPANTPGTPSETWCFNLITFLPLQVQRRAGGGLRGKKQQQVWAVRPASCLFCTERQCESFSSGVIL